MHFDDQVASRHEHVYFVKVINDFLSQNLLTAEDLLEMTVNFLLRQACIVVDAFSDGVILLLHGFPHRAHPLWIQILFVHDLHNIQNLKKQTLVLSVNHFAKLNPLKNAIQYFKCRLGQCGTLRQNHVVE